MCGLCGVLNFDGQAPVDREGLAAMTATLQNRGPDDLGYYLSGPVGLGHRRLAPGLSLLPSPAGLLLR